MKLNQTAYPPRTKNPFAKEEAESGTIRFTSSFKQFQEGMYEWRTRTVKRTAPDAKENRARCEPNCRARVSERTEAGYAVELGSRAATVERITKGP